MERIQYFRIFGFLAFTGSALLSAIFHYPAFTLLWFGIMIMFMAANSCESSELIILVFSVFAYIPLGLIGIFASDLSKAHPDYQFWTLTGFIFVELILAIAWLMHQNNND